LQVPVPLHTPPLHAVPAGFAASFTHCGAPLAHSRRPVWQALVLVPQLAPATQPTQSPEPSQTPPAHAVPAARPAPSTQVGLPAEQSMTPVAQAFGLLEQAPPDTHGTQVPAPLQTPPAQAVPASLGASSTQIGAPEPQVIRPLAHAAFGLSLQVAPSSHGVQPVSPHASKPASLSMVVPVEPPHPSAQAAASSDVRDRSDDGQRRALRIIEGTSEARGAGASRARARAAAATGAVLARTSTDRRRVGEPGLVGRSRDAIGARAGPTTGIDAPPSRAECLSRRLSQSTRNEHDQRSIRQ
jgi:hypothetical protein